MSVDVIGRLALNLFARAWLRTTRKRMPHHIFCYEIVAYTICAADSRQKLRISGSPVINWKLYRVFPVTGTSRAHGAERGSIIVEHLLTYFEQRWRISTV
jgi:hypothetical protein